MPDPDQTTQILKHLASIDGRLAKVDRIDERLQRVEDAIGPVERLAKVTDMAYWRGASAALRETRANLAEIVHDILAGIHPARGPAQPRNAESDGEPPAATTASLRPPPRRDVRVAACAAAVVFLAVSLTYATWEPAGDTRRAALPSSPSPPLSPTPPVAAPTPTRSSAPPAQVAPPGVGLATRRADTGAGRQPSPAGGGTARKDPPGLLFEPSSSPAPSPAGGCSGLGVQVRRIEVCRQRP